MSNVQLHLALTHAPVIISIIGTVMFIASLFSKNTTVSRVSYILMITAGIAAIPVFFTGEGAEDAVENLPGVYESLIGKHEDAATLAAISIAVTGVASLFALIANKWQKASQVIRMLVLLFAITSSALMTQTAHLGGQIRHTEIRTNSNLQNKGTPAGKPQNSEQHEEKNDD